MILGWGVFLFWECPRGVVIANIINLKIGIIDTILNANNQIAYRTRKIPRLLRLPTSL